MYSVSLIIQGSDGDVCLAYNVMYSLHLIGINVMYVLQGSSVLQGSKLRGLHRVGEVATSGSALHETWANFLKQQTTLTP